MSLHPCSCGELISLPPDVAGVDCPLCGRLVVATSGIRSKPKPPSGRLLGSARADVPKAPEPRTPVYEEPENYEVVPRPRPRSLLGGGAEVSLAFEQTDRWKRDIEAEGELLGFAIALGFVAAAHLLMGLTLLLLIPLLGATFLGIGVLEGFVARGLFAYRRWALVASCLLVFPFACAAVTVFLFTGSRVGFMIAICPLTVLWCLAGCTDVSSREYREHMQVNGWPTPDPTNVTFSLGVLICSTVFVPSLVIAFALSGTLG